MANDEPTPTSDPTLGPAAQAAGTAPVEANDPPTVKSSSALETVKVIVGIALGTVLALTMFISGFNRDAGGLKISANARPVEPTSATSTPVTNEMDFSTITAWVVTGRVLNNGRVVSDARVTLTAHDPLGNSLTLPEKLTDVNGEFTFPAILDRFLHNAEVIAITGKSYRLKDRGGRSAAATEKTKSESDCETAEK